MAFSVGSVERECFVGSDLKFRYVILGHILMVINIENASVHSTFLNLNTKFRDFIENFSARCSIQETMRYRNAQ